MEDEDKITGALRSRWATYQIPGLCQECSDRERPWGHLCSVCIAREAGSCLTQEKSYHRESPTWKSCFLFKKLSSSTLNLCVYIYTHTRKFSREQWISLRMLQYLFSFLEPLILKEVLSFNKIVQSRCVDCSRPSFYVSPHMPCDLWEIHTRCCFSS